APVLPIGLPAIQASVSLDVDIVKRRITPHRNEQSSGRAADSIFRTLPEDNIGREGSNDYAVLNQRSAAIDRPSRIDGLARTGHGDSLYGGARLPCPTGQASKRAALRNTQVARHSAVLRAWLGVTALLALAVGIL